MIREYRPEDLKQLQQIHREQNLGYTLPNIEDPIFLSKIVEEDNGTIRAAILLRVTSEGYLLFGPGGHPVERWRRLVALHEAARLEAIQRGLSDIHVWCPPRLEKSFGKRLGQLNWQKALWPCYVLELEGEENGARRQEEGP